MRHDKQTRDQFADEAIGLMRTANKLNERAQQERNRIAAIHGDNGWPFRFRISGGLCEHWPDEEKDIVRALVSKANEATDQSFDLWRKAGRRSHTWRKHYQQIVTD